MSLTITLVRPVITAMQLIMMLIRPIVTPTRFIIIPTRRGGTPTGPEGGDCRPEIWECRLQVLFLQSRGDFIVVGDLMRSISLLTYKPVDGQVPDFLTA